MTNQERENQKIDERGDAIIDKKREREYTRDGNTYVGMEVGVLIM